METQNHKKTNKFLLTGGILLASFVVLIAASNLNSDTLNLSGRAQTAAQTVKAWNFDKSTEGWKSRFTRDSVAKNGNLNVKIGQTFFTPLIFNRRVFTQLPLPLKYFSLNLAIQKRKEINIPANFPTPVPLEPLTQEDVQILSLPEQTASPSATDETVACTTDVKTCADGSFVTRVAPNCEFLPCPEKPSLYFTFDLQFKTAGSFYWSKPFPVTGKISPDFHEYTIKIPVINPITIEAVKIEFRSGIGRGDIILIDSMKLLNEKLIIPTRIPTKVVAGCNQPCSPGSTQCAPGLDCILIGPPQTTPPIGLHESTGEAQNMPIAYLCRNPKNPNSSTCTVDITPPPSCLPPPPCAYGGVTDEQGNRLYCEPPVGLIWCPRPDPTIIVEPCTSRPACADGILSPEGYKMFCYPPTGSFWCPKTTLTPTPTQTPTPTPAEPTTIPCAVPTAPLCENGTITASDIPQTAGVCPPKYICVFSDTPTPAIIP